MINNNDNSSHESFLYEQLKKVTYPQTTPHYTV